MEAPPIGHALKAASGRLHTLLRRQASVTLHAAVAGDTGEAGIYACWLHVYIHMPRLRGRQRTSKTLGCIYIPYTYGRSAAASREHHLRTCGTRIGGSEDTLHTCIHCIHACMHTCIRAYIHTYMYTYMQVLVSEKTLGQARHAFKRRQEVHACMCVCAYVRMYVCMYVCVCAFQGAAGGACM